MPLVEALVFDCDGTLLNTGDVKTRAFRQIGNLYSPEAGTAMAAWHRANGGVTRMEKFAWMFREVLGRDMGEEEGRDLAGKFRDFCIDELKNSPPVQGAPEVLAHWHGRIPMYVASATPQTELEEILDGNGMSRFFSGIFGYPPGKTGLLKKAVAVSGAASMSTLMIGDSPRDLEAALTVGAMFYGVGPDMEHCGTPWHQDLTAFNAWLEAELAGF